ncbi:MAG: iron-containing alcohol dehydrogenase [Christensenellales bacterium]|jgi:alcohol dehydrogenase class IV
MYSVYYPSRLEFGVGAFDKLKDILPQYGQKYAVVYSRSAEKNGTADRLKAIFDKAGISFVHYVYTSGEPSPSDVEEALAIFRPEGCDAVLGIGGGSVLDTAKSVAGVMRCKGKVEDYIELGDPKPFDAPPLPFIAVPTTAGTGSEATKNAVLSDTSRGFKVSLRHDSLIAKASIIDPELCTGVPKEKTAQAGTDAVAQLVEAYMSKKANPFTDAVSMRGIKLAAKWLPVAYEDGGNLEARGGMSMAAYFSGMALANATLGAPHGLAAGIGAHFDIPHGLLCGIMLPHAMKYNIKESQERLKEIGFTATGKYDAAAAIEWVEGLNAMLGVPKDLKGLGISEDDIDKIYDSRSAGTLLGNPRHMGREEAREFLLNLI